MEKNIHQINGFEYLAMFTKTYKNKEGGTGGKLVLFHQDKKSC